jgi:hypothetical protein
MMLYSVLVGRCTIIGGRPCIFGTAAAAEGLKSKKNLGWAARREAAKMFSSC